MLAATPLAPPPGRPTGRRGVAAVAWLLLLALPAAAGCAGRPPADAAQIKLSVFWWGGTERDTITKRVLELYTSRHPNVTFTASSQPNNGYYDKLAARAAGGTAPDVFQIDDNFLAEYVDRGIVADLTAHLGTGGQIDTGRLPASLLAYGTIDGKPYGIPNAENTPAMFYDRTLLRQLGMPEPQIGWSYEQLITWACQVSARTGGATAGTMDPSADYKALWLWLRTQGKELYRGGALAFDGNDLRRWLDMWASARQRGATPPADVIVAAHSNETRSQLVVNRRGATTFAWSNMLTELQNATDHELGITAYPGDPKGQWARASQFWSIYRGGSHPTEAARVIDFLVNDPEAGRILGTERGLPANLDVRAKIATTLAAPMRATVDFENAMTPRFGPAPAPPPAGHGQIRTLLAQAAESVEWGRATTAEATTQFMNQALSVLSG